MGGLRSSRAQDDSGGVSKSRGGQETDARREAQEKENEQDSDKDEDKYVDKVDMPGTKMDFKQRITVRNRIQEDTAKYLRNLDPNSAYYDPKTKSMWDNSYAGTEQIRRS